ncbi:hypothetical protein ABVK25_002522 [Lepraria finkii]|uniref:Uncharacterized protein n=1 Tax=Lepraria finkii TaxID=1340010 RepID=A0ABR4BL34_9LECA
MTSALEQGYAAVGIDGAEVMVVAAAVVPTTARDAKDVIASRMSERCSPMSLASLSGSSPGYSPGTVAGGPIGFGSLGDVPSGLEPLSGDGSEAGAFGVSGLLAQARRLARQEPLE